MFLDSWDNICHELALYKLNWVRVDNVTRLWPKSDHEACFHWWKLNSNQWTHLVLLNRSKGNPWKVGSSLGLLVIQALVWLVWPGSGNHDEGTSRKRNGTLVPVRMRLLAGTRTAIKHRYEDVSSSVDLSFRESSQDRVREICDPEAQMDVRIMICHLLDSLHSDLLYWQILI